MYWSRIVIFVAGINKKFMIRKIKFARLCVVLFFVAMSGLSYAQQNVGIGTNVPDQSAILDLSTQDKGILIPRLSTAQKLAISAPATGLFVYDTDANQFSYFDGVVWRWAIGPMGPTGPAGVSGIDGPTGPQGLPGVAGIDGPTGPQGVQGIQGIQGIQGVTGPSGIQGVQGLQGIPGVTGPTGPQGVQGFQGVQGVQGDPGPTGPQGVQGIQGLQGLQGTTGATGASGAMGVTGPTGPLGCSQANYVVKSNGTNATCTLAPIYDNGNVGIGNTNPVAKLHLAGGSFLISGNVGNTPVSGGGTRMMFIPSKGAIRAGNIASNVWDASQIGTSSVALGEETWATGTGSVALGYFSKAWGNYSTASGFNAQATADGATAFGYLAQASGYTSFATGEDTRATGWWSTAMGFRSKALKNNSVAIGNNCVADGISAIAIGDSAIADSTYSLAIGRKVTARREFSVAMGTLTLATGYVSTATGYMTTASGNQSFAMNDHAVSSGYASVAMNQQTNATGERTVAMGNATTASGLDAVSMGQVSVASGDNSVAMGYYTNSNVYAALTIGKYNSSSGSATAWNSGEPLFVAGNGSSGSPANAAVLYKNGNMWIAGTLTQLSDSTLKEKILPINNILAKLDAIQPIYFEFKDKETHPAGRQIGFAAQEVEKQFPELTSHDENGNLGVNYSGFTAVLLQAVKELKAENDALKARVDQLEKKRK